MNTQMDLGMTLRVLRAQKGWSLREAEEMSGVERHAISGAEQGSRIPRLPTLAKLAAAYDVPVSQLIAAREAEGKVEAGQLFDIARETLYERLPREEFERLTRNLSREDLIGEYMDLMTEYLRVSPEEPGDG
jgi:transcriptional regulator with XRE-family HTH domain